MQAQLCIDCLQWNQLDKFERNRMLEVHTSVPVYNDTCHDEYRDLGDCNCPKSLREVFRIFHLRNELGGMR